MNRTAVVAFCGFFLLLFAVSHVLLAEQGGGNRRGTGSSCTYNWMANAKHVYFKSDSDWATNTIPDDECTTSCTAQTLNTSTGINETDLTTSGLPAGTGASRVMLPFTAADDQATSNVRLMQAANNGDWAFCAWMRITQTNTEDLVTHTSSGNTADAFLYANTTLGIVGLFTQGNSTDLLTSLSAITVNTWSHICWSVDNDGSAGGTDVRKIYVNGVQQANDNGPDNTGGTLASTGFRTAGSNFLYEVHEGVFMHQAITANQACQVMSCGVDDSATFATRRSTYGACTL